MCLFAEDDCSTYSLTCLYRRRLLLPAFRCTTFSLGQTRVQSELLFQDPVQHTHSLTLPNLLPFYSEWPFFWCPYFSRRAVTYCDTFSPGHFPILSPDVVLIFIFAFWLLEVPSFIVFLPSSFIYEFCIYMYVFDGFTVLYPSLMLASSPPTSRHFNCRVIQRTFVTNSP